MKKKFKSIYLVLVFILTLSISILMIGCSNDKSNQATEDKEILKIFIPGYNDEVWKNLYDASINDFEKDNPK